MHSGAYFSRLFRLALLVAATALLMVLGTSAGRLNLSYLTPGGGIAVDQQLLTTTPLRVCALTFDDGPDDTYTRQVMEVLDGFGIKGTFFLVGERVSKYPDEVRALIHSGHEIGNHSWSHRDMRRLSTEAQRREMTKTNDELAKLGIAPHWFRPPYGEFNSSLLGQTADLGMEAILWSVDPKDWSQPGVKTITNRVLRQTSPGAVILMHSTNAQTVAALPGLITSLNRRGYTFATLSQWRALVTGAATAPPPGQLMYLPPADSGLAIPHQPVNEPFYAPRQAPEADNAQQITAVPRVIEELENRTPEDRAHVIWSWAASHAPEARLKPGTRLIATVLSPQAESTAALPVDSASGQLTVYANFTGAAAAARVFDDGGETSLQRFSGERQDLAAEPPRRIDVMLDGEDQAKIEDTPVSPAPALPVLPEGEELVLPPVDGEPATAQAETTPAETAEPAAPAEQAAPEAPEEAAPPAPPPPAELPHVPLTIVDLVDLENPATEWNPPATLDPSQFTPYQPPIQGDGPFPEASYYFLSMAGDLEHYTWVELKTYLRLAKLSGLVLPDGWFAPPADLPYPWTFAGPLGTDQSAWIDLTVEDVADVMEVLKRGKHQVFIVVRPTNLHFFIAAHSWSEMNYNMRDFVLFRQLTGGMELQPHPATALDWWLPNGVELARFTDGRRKTLVLYSQSYRAVRVPVPPSCQHMSRAFIDAGGYLKIAPLADDYVVVDRSPAILYYEPPAD